MPGYGLATDSSDSIALNCLTPGYSRSREFSFWDWEDDNKREAFDCLQPNQAKCWSSWESAE